MNHEPNSATPKPSTPLVAATPKPVEDLRRRLMPESGEIWTDRMLNALLNGVRGNRWYSLWDKLCQPKVIRLAAEKVIRKGSAPGLDHRTCGQVKRELEVEVETILRQLRVGSYRPQPVKRVWIEKLGSPEKRPLGIPTVRDRIVQTAVLLLIGPIFENGFAEHSYGFRPGRKAQQALARVEEQLKGGLVWVVDADLKGYFDSIPHDKLMEVVRQKIADGRILELIEKFLNQGVMDSLRGWQPTEGGTPQGAVLSPLLANAYLDSLDHEMAQRGYRMTRYADDFVVLCLQEKEAQEALEKIGQWTAQAGLTLHPTKTRLVNASVPGGFDFLGWHFERGHKWPRDKSLKRFKEAIRQETRRTQGKSLSRTITLVNRRSHGWTRYFHGGVAHVYVRLDKWIRMRLRSILRRNEGRDGRGRGKDHQRYPNSFFDERGLHSLEVLNRVLSAPATGTH